MTPEMSTARIGQWMGSLDWDDVINEEGWVIRRVIRNSKDP